jgi:hypothetical protein
MSKNFGLESMYSGLIACGVLASRLVIMEDSGGRLEGRVSDGPVYMLILWLRDFCALRGCPEDM